MDIRHRFAAACSDMTDEQVEAVQGALADVEGDLRISIHKISELSEIVTEVRRRRLGLPHRHYVALDEPEKGG